MEDVEAFLSGRLNIPNLMVTIKDRNWGIGEVWELEARDDGNNDMIYIGRLDVDTFYPES